MSSETVLTVAELTELVAEKLEYAPDLKGIWVKGEIAECTRSSMGHWYFNLKDDAAVLKVVLFASQARNLKFTLTSGMEVLVKGSISVYRARGVYQMLATDVESAGQGAYRQALLELISRLEKDGYFAKKRPLPEYPLKIGVVTSQSGAAIEDIKRVVGKRWPVAEIQVFDTLVQGADAPASIVRALHQAYTADLDVLILARGGGSSDDLWAFNDEDVAKVLFTSPIPTITGVGHEIDRTIVDLVADYAAPTPSGAAEAAVPDIEEVLKNLAALKHSLYNYTLQALMEREKLLSDYLSILNQYEPKKELLRIKEKVRSLDSLLKAKTVYTLELKRKNFNVLEQRLSQHHPERLIGSLREKVSGQAYKLDSTVHRRFAEIKDAVANLIYGVELLNPENVLKKGYAIVLKEKAVVKSTADVKAGDKISAKVRDGVIHAVVTATYKEEEADGQNRSEKL